MNNYGFRVKMNDYLESRELLNNFLQLYFSLFSIMEVKVDSFLVNNKNFDYLLYCLYDKNVSYHISKNYVNYPTESDIKLINALSYNKEIYLVTHIPEQLNLECLVKIGNSLNSNVKLLFENPSSFKLQSYLSYLISFYNSLGNLNNMGCCLDFGHLLFNEYKNGSGSYLDELLSKVNSENFFELHVHDFNFMTDHQKIGDGIMNLENIKKLIDIYFYNSRIILETNVDNVDLSDGVRQIKRILKV